MRMLSAPARPTLAFGSLSSFHLGCLGVAMKTSLSASQFRSMASLTASGSQPTSSSSLPSRSRLQRSSTELCMAVPSEAAMPALRGSPCFESQYFLGHSSNLFQEVGESWCCLSSAMAWPPMLFLRESDNG